MLFITEIEVLEGLDLSHWNLKDGETITWPLVTESGIVFIIGKSTESDYFTDGKWPYYRDSCITYSIPLATYHFYRFDKTPEEQAQFCLDYIGCPFPIIVWVDVETLTSLVLGIPKGSSVKVYKNAIDSLKKSIVATPNLIKSVSIDGKIVDINLSKFLAGIANATDEVLRFMRYIENNSANKSGMYSSPYFIKTVFGDPASNDFLNFYLWIAHVGASRPSLQRPWNTLGEWPNNKKVLVWQYRWDKTVPGIPDPTLDANKFSTVAGSISAIFMNGNAAPPTLPEKVYVNSAYGINIRRVPTDKDGNLTVCGTSAYNKEHHPEEIVLDEKSREWYKVTAYIAKWLTRT